MPELASVDRVRSDFDAIARLAAGRSYHNAHYHPLLLRELPARIGAALDLGCGTGELTRHLAGRSDAVLGLDLSPEMLRVARAENAAHANVRLEQRDFLAWDAPRGRFDCVVSVATLHHLAMVPALVRIRDALAPGGTLAVLDLVRDATPLDLARSALAMPVNLALRVLHTGALREPPAVRAAWAAHGATDHYLSLAEVRAACAEAGLAGAHVRRLLLWRYLLVWRKPA